MSEISDELIEKISDKVTKRVCDNVGDAFIKTSILFGGIGVVCFCIHYYQRRQYYKKQSETGVVLT